MYLVLIGGGHAAGKRTVAHDLAKQVNKGSDNADKSAVSLTVPTKVVDLGTYQGTPYEPDVDFARLRKDLKKEDATTVVFVHGVYALYDADLNNEARLKIYLDSDADVRLSQWILRDSAHTPLNEILQEYLDKCRPEFLRHVEQTKGNADVLLPQGSDKLTIELLAYDVKFSVLKKLEGRSSERLGTPMINLRAEVASNIEDHYYATN